MRGRCLDGRKVALVGGDRRQDYLAAILGEQGAECWLVRRRPPGPAGVRHSVDLREGVSGASLVVLPMPPFGPDFKLWSEDPEDSIRFPPELLVLLSRPAVVLAGSFPSDFAREADRLGCAAVPLGDLDELAVLNSVPTAEGAVLLALERSTVTIHGSRAAVLGYGRTGQTLASTLRALGGRVVVVARRPEARARAVAAGCEAARFEELADAVAGARFVFNTVPAPVLGEEILSRLGPCTVVVDLASAPGGTDFEAARRLGIEAVLAPSLPGRVAPETAAGYLAGVVLRVAAERLEPEAVVEG
ncbi:MAG: dipicolinate synthase subunit DpsA [Firmicutes bacterium]|nr:dipicolinate synthase subunit DpsA [Bacillota bacterium]